MRWIRSLFSSKKPLNRKPVPRARLRVERLEDRLNPFVVNSLLDTGDANPGDGIAADANGVTTLRAAVDEANALANGNPLNGAVLIDFDSTNWAGANTITLNSTLTISANMTINAALVLGAPNDPTVWLTSTAGGVIVDAEVIATMQRIGFRDFNDEMAGAPFSPLKNSGVLYVSECRFEDNRASGSGGAIDNAGSMGISGSRFYDNLAVAGSGGAILNGGTLTIANTNFSGNTSGLDGGAIIAQANSHVTISGGQFYLNDAPGKKGGAIAIIANATVTVGGTDFLENLAGIGGAIYNSGGSFEMEGGRFEGNAATDGGAIYDSVGLNLVLKLVVVQENSAERGGALYLKYTKNVHIEGCNFTDNSSVGTEVAYHGIISDDPGANHLKVTIISSSIAPIFLWDHLGN
jgi:large repetitive protein